MATVSDVLTAVSDLLAKFDGLFSVSGADKVVTLDKTTAGNIAAVRLRSGGEEQYRIGLLANNNLTVQRSTNGSTFDVHVLSVDGAGNASFGGRVSANQGMRELLSFSRNYYVNDATGSDGATGLVGDPFKTIGKAVAVVATLDMGGYGVTINIAAGTYPENVVLPDIVGGQCYIVGDEVTPANVVISPASGSAVQASGVTGTWHLRGFKIAGAGISNGIWNNSASIYFRNLDFGAIAAASFNRHINVLGFGHVEAEGDYTISGTSGMHCFGDSKALIVVVARTVTLTGVPAFPTRFCQVTGHAEFKANANTFVGTATGQRYFASSKGVIQTSGGGETYLPGNASGLVTQDGLYV